jgi:uncharacterized membrane protein
VAIDKSTVGPIEILAVEFPGSQFKGEIVPALKELVDDGIINILDLVFVTKDLDGTVASLELSQLSTDESAAYGELGVSEDDIDGLLNDEDLEMAGEVMDPGDSAAILVWEDLWAIKVRDAIRNAGGKLLALDRVPQEAVDEVLDALAEG